MGRDGTSRRAGAPGNGPHLAGAALALAVLLVAAPGVRAETPQIRRDVEFLASTPLRGRLTGTPGERKAADHIRRSLESIGALPLPGLDGYFQDFEFTAGMKDAGTSISFSGSDGKTATWKKQDQVRGLSFSDVGTASGGVVFAGYGLTLPDGQEFSYDSYAGLDVKGKIVVILRYAPEDTTGDLRAALARFSGLRYKAMRARELGAAGLLVATGPRSNHAGETIPMGYDAALAGSGIVAASIGGEVADRLFAGGDGRTFEEIQRSLDDGNPHVQGFDLQGMQVRLDVALRRERRIGRNVMGVLPATGGAADDGVLILGAHYDHLGRGGQGSSLATDDEAHRIHPGADDNASGVAAVLEIGRRLVGAERRRAVVLAFWSGEELGLLGSSRFLSDGPLPRERIVAYLNFDMVGRMEEGRLDLQSVGSSAAWPGLAERANVPVGLDLNLLDDPYLPTDSIAFYEAHVPSLAFFTGTHPDYHRPGDTPDKVNYEGIDRTVELATRLVGGLQALETRPQWVEVERTQPAGDRDTLRAYTGTIPDYSSEGEGLRLAGVVGGGPADAAGLREGDVIVEFAGRTIANIYDYTYALDAVKVDEEVPVVFLRDGERRQTTITPKSRP